jgi:glutamyl/glutaminyl-tRNA synthetase
MSIDALHQRLMSSVLTEERLKALLEQAQPRINLLDEFVPYVSFFFGGSLDYSAVLPQFRIKTRTRADVTGVLRQYLEEIEVDPRARAWTIAGLDEFSRDFCERHGWKGRELFQLLRLATTGRTAAPGLFETMHLCGKDRVRRRIREVIELLATGPDW